MSRQKVYFAGLPTDVDVRALFERWGVPAEGVPIPYDDVRDVLRVPVDSSRFRTVTQAWRRRLEREHNVIMKAESGVFVARTPAQRIDLSSAKFRTGARAFGKGLRVAETTDADRLTTQERGQRDHLLLVGGTVRAQAVLAARKKAPQLPASVGG